MRAILAGVTVFGVTYKPNRVTVNYQDVHFFQANAVSVMVAKVVKVAFR